MVGHQLGQGAGEHSIQGDAERAGTVQPAKVMIRGYREDGAKVFSGVCSDRQEAMDKLKHGKFQLCIRKKGVRVFFVYLFKP